MITFMDFYKKFKVTKKIPINLEYSRQIKNLV